jgi:hypothetical protein
MACRRRLDKIETEGITGNDSTSHVWKGESLLRYLKGISFRDALSTYYAGFTNSTRLGLPMVNKLIV